MGRAIMTAGSNCRVSVWRWLFVEDDSVGGAEPTGTYVYNDMIAFLQEEKVEQVLLQQGLEVPRLFTANVVPSWYTIYERDEIEIMAPTDHGYYGERFRVIDSHRSSHNRRDPRGYLMLTLVRSERSHGQQ